MKTLDQLLKSGTIVVLRENEGFICGCTVRIEKDCIATLAALLSHIEQVETIQEWAGADLESATRQAVELESTPY